MLDVHPPEHPSHSWRDFFIHMGTICLGLLIAIALEQTVEALHRHHQRHELLDQLETEHRSNLQDTRGELTATIMLANYRADVINAMRATLWTGKPYIAPVQPKLPPYNIAADHIWLATKASGMASLLPRENVIVNSEIEALITYRDQLHLQFQATRNEEARACNAITPPGQTTPDFAHADRKDIQNCIGAKVAMYTAMRLTIVWAGYLSGAEEAAEAGETDIDRINQKEVDVSELWQKKLTPIQ